MGPLRITAIVLAALWGLGMATSALGGFVHVLAVVAVALLLIELVTKRRVSH
jgi:uncharacterized membrane protein YqgA involved in biofilm formation